MGIAGAIACSFYDPATGTVVQLNSIAQGSSFSLADQFERDLDGNRIRVGMQFSLQIFTYASSGIEQLKAWGKNRTKLEFVLAGVQSNILIYSARTITVEQPFNFSPRGRQITLITMSGEGESLAAWQGSNLMHGFVLTQGFESGWQDADADGLPDGYGTIPGPATLDFTDDEFNITTDSIAQRVLTVNSLFPIAGVQLTLSSEWTLLHSTIDNSMQIGGLAFDGATSTFNQVETIAATGRQIVQAVTGPDTYTIRPYAFRLSGGSSSSDTAGVKYPALRTDGLSLYTE